jgi:hypothetical protein
MDSGMSASELRQRYHKGGSVPDSDLSSSQLRARYGVASNKNDFSTSHKINNGMDATMLYAIIAIVGIVGIFIVVHFVF